MSVINEPGTLIYAEAKEALDAKGYVLKKNTDGTVSKAIYGDMAIGVNFITTWDPITNDYVANKMVSIVPRGQGFIVKVRKTTGTGTAITKGSLVKLSSTAGLVEAAGSPPAVNVTVDTSTGNGTADISELITWQNSIIGIAIEDAGDSDEYVTIILW